MSRDTVGGENAQTLSGEYWCPIDNETFDSEAELKAHYREAHPQEMPPQGGAASPGDGGNGRQRAAQIDDLLGELIAELRRGANDVPDPRGQALFETGAEVLVGLRTAFEHYRAQAEPAWRDARPEAPPGTLER